MGRPKNRTKTVRKTFYLPESLRDQVDLILLDPLTGEAAFDSWNKLMTGLLTEWLSLRRESNALLNDLVDSITTIPGDAP